MSGGSTVRVCTCQKWDVKVGQLMVKCCACGYWRPVRKPTAKPEPGTGKAGKA